MKHLFIILLFCCLFFRTNAQKEYVPIWTAMLRDSSLSPELPIILDPIQILEDKNNDIYTLNQFYFGWTLIKTNGKTGKTLWTANRTFKYPNKDSSQYWVSKIFLNEKNNTIEVLGCRLWSKYPNLAFQASGNGAKVIYSLDNGNEIYYTSPNYLKGGLLITGYGSHFVKNNNGGYYILEGNKLSGLPFYGWLRKVNSNFSKIDTLSIFNIDNEIDNLGFSNTSKPLFLNNHIYYYAQFDLKDKHYYRLHKVDTLGNLVFMKNIYDKFYSIPSRVQTEQRLGGLVFTSGADTTSTNGNNLSYYLLKLNENGVFQWRSFFTSPDPKPDNTFFLCEEIKDKGFFVIGSAWEKKHSNLYWVDKSGKIKYLGKIKVPQYKDEKIVTRNAIINTKNQLIISFGFTKCLDPNETEICEDTYAGIAFIGDIDIENLISIKEIEFPKIQIFPNPAESQIEVRSNEGFDEVKIYDMIGKIQTSIFTQNSTIEIATLPSGLYFVELYKENKKISETKKFIKL
jgi:hypothetical protein